MATRKWDVDPVHSNISFSARHLMVARVHGRFTKWTAHIEIDEDDPVASRIEVEIDAASLDTKERPRDEHLKSDDFLAVGKHPHILFSGRKIERRGRDRYALTGDLTIVGISRPVTLDVAFVGKTRDPRGGERAGFSARATVNRKDWGLNWNPALEAGGLLVGEKVEVAVDLELFHPRAA